MKVKVLCDTCKRETEVEEDSLEPVAGIPPKVECSDCFYDKEI